MAVIWVDDLVENERKYMNDEQRRWLVAAIRYGGSFVSSFATTCFAADEDNFALVEPLLNQFMSKYSYYSNVDFTKENR